MSVLSRGPQQSLDPAEISLPGAAWRPKLPQETPWLGPRVERLQQAEAPPLTTSEATTPSLSALPACPRLLTDTHIRAAHSRTPTRISAGVRTLLLLDSSIAEHTAAPSRAQEPMRAMPPHHPLLGTHLPLLWLAWVPSEGGDLEAW